MVVVTHSAEETEAIGERIARMVRAGSVICLFGEIGAGKTTLTRGIARGLGVTGPVLSPTFMLIHEHPGDPPLFHIDLYRLEHVDQVAGLGMDEYFDRGVTVIEWPEKAGEALPPQVIEARLSVTGDTARRVELSYRNGTKSEDLPLPE